MWSSAKKASWKDRSFRAIRFESVVKMCWKHDADSLVFAQM